MEERYKDGGGLPCVVIICEIAGEGGRMVDGGGVGFGCEMVVAE